MKEINRKRLITSLAASIMLATTTLAPLSSFVISGNIYAAPIPTPPAPPTSPPIPTPPTSTPIPTPPHTPTPTSTPIPTPTPTSTPIPTPTPTSTPTPTPTPPPGSLFVIVDSPARLNLYTQNGNGIDVQNTYKCSGGTGKIVLMVQQLTTQSGSGISAIGNNVSDWVPVVCDSVQHDVSATLIPLTGSYNLGTASVTAKLTDGSTPAQTATNTATVPIVV
jgi:hypothetical protein